MVAGHSIIPAEKETERERDRKKVSSNQMEKYEESFQKEKIFVILISFSFPGIG